VKTPIPCLVEHPMSRLFGRDGVIRIVEVVHGIFYAPHYVALGLGVYAGEGLDVQAITTVFGDGERYLRSGEADILVAAPMRTMRQFELNGERIVSIAPVLIRHPWYLLGRDPAPSFSWDDLIGHSVIDFAEGETSILCLRYLLRLHGVSDNAVEIIEGLRSTEAVAAFRAGRGDYLLHTLHTGEQLLEDGVAKCAIALAPDVGDIPFTAFATFPENLAAHEEVLARFRRAYGRALTWLADHNAVDVAAILTPFFPTHSPELLRRSVGRYQALGVWPREPELSASGFEHFKDILASVGWLKGTVTYGSLTWDAAGGHRSGAH
jgi:NitT/TauT family transport system substrate-binding protein